MSPKLTGLLSISRAEVWLSLQSSLLLPVVAASLRLAGFQRTYLWLDQPLAGEEPNDIAPISRSVNRAAYHLPGFNPACLPRSLVLWHLLRRRGTPAQLCIGVAKERDQLMAHAWVESNGQVVNDRPDVAQRYAPIDFLYSSPEDA